jgi:hypothetical protein
VSDDLTSTVGVIAIAAGAVALVALVLVLVLMRRIKRLRNAQRVVLGTTGERDLVSHAQSLGTGFEELRRMVEGTFSQLSERLDRNERLLGRTISKTAVIRYDAYDEMTGRQSSSIALLDDRRNGLVLSSILHREQARMYAKPVVGGQSEIGLSPEEEAAVAQALSGGPSPSP